MKASIATSFARAYKYGNETASLPEEEFDNFSYGFNIGSFEKLIDLSRFDVTYYANDTNQEHPVYILKEDYMTEKINLNGESINTLFVNDKKSVNYRTKEEITDKVIGYGFGSDGQPDPYTVICNHTSPTTAKTLDDDVEPADRYNQVFFGESRYYYQRNYSGMVPRLQHVYDTLFENGTIEGVTTVYFPDDDSMIVPAINTELYKLLYYNKLGTKVYMREPIVQYIYDGSLTQGGANNYLKGLQNMFELIQENQEDEENPTFVTFYPPVPYSGSGISVRMGYGLSTGSRLDDCKTITFFVRDANGEYWLWNVGFLPGYVDYSYPRPGYITEHIEYVVKVKDLPIAQMSSGVISSSSATWLSSEQFTDLSTVDAYLDLVFNPVVGSNYDDGGADAVGPGDPYADIGNAGDVVGGQENTEDVLEVNDKDPNGGMTQYLVSGGLYGAYKLNSTNLQQYTNTLNMLYAKSSDLILGSIWEQYASRITKNSTSLIMLPYDIPAKCLTDEAVNFIVGNAYIAGTTESTQDNWDSYKVGGSIGQAYRVVTEYATFTTDLGYLDHYYDTFLDFAPYVSASLYLPYIGQVPLPINLIQSTSGERKHLTLTWNISNLTGDIVCLLNVNDMTIMYWTGNCARSVPLSIDNNGAFLRECTQQIVGSVLSALK